MTRQNRIDSIAKHIEAIIELLGENPKREGLVRTPQRAAKALIDLTDGYSNSPAEVMGNALFEHEGSQMVLVKDIEFYSLCEHHILPFFGKVSVAYIPDGKIVGLSKIARVVDVFARRLQVQERFTEQLAESIRKLVGAKGVIVYCQGEHLCMKMRGVEKQHSATVTVHYNGAFEDPILRAEFLNAVR